MKNLLTGMLCVIALLILSCGGSKTDNKTAEEYFKEVPKSLNLTFMDEAQLNVYLGGNTVAEPNKKVVSEDGKMLSCMNSDPVQSLIVNLYTDEDGKPILSVLTTFQEAWQLILAKKDGDTWTNVSETKLPAELNSMIKDGTFRIYPEMTRQNIVFTDMDADKKMTLVWKDNKYVLDGAIPEKFGKSME